MPLEFIRSRLPRHRLLRGVAVIAGGTALSQALGAIAAPVLTRLYVPGAFGVYAVYLSILGLVSALGSLRYELAIPLAEDETGAARVLVLCALVLGTMSVAAVAILGGLGRAVIRWTDNPGMKPYLWLLPLGFLAMGSFSIMNYWLIRQKSYGAIARAKLVQGISMISTQLAGGFFSFGPLGLLLGQIAGHGSAAVWVLRSIWRDRRRIFARITLAGLRREARRFRRFPLFSSAGALLNSAGGNLPMLLFAVLYGPVAAGWLGLGQRLTGSLYALAGDTVARVYFGEAAALATNHPERLRRLYDRALVRLLLLGAALMVLIIAVGPSGFAAILGPEWRMTGIYLRYLSVALVFQFAVGSLSQTLNILERQGLQLAWDLVRLLLGIASLGTAKAFGWPAAKAVLVFSGTSAASYLLLLALTRRALSRRERLWSPKETVVEGRSSFISGPGERP